MSEYREQADVGEEPGARIEDGLRDVLTALKPFRIEDGLRDVLTALKPFDHDDMTRIVLAVAALYDLPIVDLNLGGDDGDEVTE
jgi:hypothetical protein